MTTTGAVDKEPFHCPRWCNVDPREHVEGEAGVGGAGSGGAIHSSKRWAVAGGLNVWFSSATTHTTREPVTVYVGDYDLTVEEARRLGQLLLGVLIEVEWVACSACGVVEHNPDGSGDHRYLCESCL